MKKGIFLFFLTTLSLQSFSQSLYNYAKSYLRENGYTISADQQADLAQGETAGHVKTFYSGNRYMIIALSDDSDVSDVDVFLYYTNGTLDSKDADTEKIAVLTFEPSYTRDMRVVVKNYASSTPRYKSKCRIIIGYK
jgi:hypothetical protein